MTQMFINFDLKIGFRCNNNCKHCVVANKRSTKDLSFSELQSIVSTIPGGSVVQITGGEPTCYSILPSILEECKKKNLYTVIQTNGTGFSDNDFLKECAPYLDHVHLAIHSCIPEIHDKIVEASGMWNKTIQGLENILDQGIEFTTQTVLSQYNISSLYDTFSFIQKKKPDTRMSMTYPHLMGNAYTNREEVAFRYSDYKDVIQKTLREFHTHLFVESIPYCYLHPYVDQVESLEKDILDPSYSRIGVDKSDGSSCKDYDTLNLQDHRKGPRCKECIYNNRCIGVWKEYIELYRNKLDLYPITKEQLNLGNNS